MGLNSKEKGFGLVNMVLCSKHAVKYHSISIQNCHIHNAVITLQIVAAVVLGHRFIGIRAL